MLNARHDIEPRMRPVLRLFAHAARLIIEAARDAGMTLSPNSRNYSPRIARGWKRCQTVCEKVRPPRPCRQSVISISRSCKRSTHRAASDATDRLIESRDGPFRVILAGHRPQARRYAAPFGASRLDRAAPQGLRLWDAVNDKMSASTHLPYLWSRGTHFIVDNPDRNQRRTLCFSN
jgi:hypothetical protein